MLESSLIMFALISSTMMIRSSHTIRGVMMNLKDLDPKKSLRAKKSMKHNKRK